MVVDQWDKQIYLRVSFTGGDAVQKAGDRGPALGSTAVIRAKGEATMNHIQTAARLALTEAADDLNALGRLIRKLFESLDNVRLSTISKIISALTATVIVVGVAATG
jgi:hypothetical protein